MNLIRNIGIFCKRCSYNESLEDIPNNSELSEYDGSKQSFLILANGVTQSYLTLEALFHRDKGALKCLPWEEVPSVHLDRFILVAAYTRNVEAIKHLISHVRANSLPRERGWIKAILERLIAQDKGEALRFFIDRLFDEGIPVTIDDIELSFEFRNEAFLCLLGYFCDSDIENLIVKFLGGTIGNTIGNTILITSEIVRYALESRGFSVERVHMICALFQQRNRERMGLPTTPPLEPIPSTQDEIETLLLPEPALEIDARRQSMRDEIEVLPLPEPALEMDAKRQSTQDEMEALLLPESDSEMDAAARRMRQSDREIHFAAETEREVRIHRPVMAITAAFALAMGCMSMMHPESWNSTQIVGVMLECLLIYGLSMQWARR